MKLLEEKLKKTELTERRGWFRFGRIPYKIRYDLDVPTNWLVNKKRPGGHLITQDLLLQGKGSKSLSVWVHESVPEDFKEIIAYHEFIEAEYRLAGGLERSEAHRLAVPYHMEYARRYLSKLTFEEFKRWQDQFDVYKNEVFYGEK